MGNIICREISGGEEIARAAYIEGVCLETAWGEAQISDLPHYAKYICALFEKEVCGIASMYIIAGEGEIMNVAVLPEYRRKGIADALMNALISIASENACDRITLEVAEDNFGAISLYEKHGFTVSGRRKGFYKGKDALNMEKKL